MCEGEYANGLEKILRTFLANLDRPEQQAAWVSGFYGSGKSHLTKILRYLWTDFEFPEDKARARGLTKLSTEVADLLKELTTAGKRLAWSQTSGRASLMRKHRWSARPRKSRATARPPCWCLMTG